MLDTDQLSDLIQQAVQRAYPKEWLSKEELSAEFGIKSTTIWKLCNDPFDPLPYSSVGTKKQLFHRADINAYLQRRKRNG